VYLFSLKWWLPVEFFTAEVGSRRRRGAGRIRATFYSMKVGVVLKLGVVSHYSSFGPLHFSYPGSDPTWGSPHVGCEPVMQIIIANTFVQIGKRSCTYILLRLNMAIMITNTATENPMKAEMKTTTSIIMDTPLGYCSHEEQLGKQLPPASSR
jgi:hypothetical protein